MDTWWNEAWITVQREFSDLSDVAQVTRVAVRLLLAVALGAVLGYERESRGTTAGLRTHILVALGAALFVLVPLQSGIQAGDMSRILQGVITGIGFLGAGAIIKLSKAREIKGLTTAASVWMTAAIGVCVGMGREATALLSTVLAFCILSMPHPRRDRQDENPD